MKVRNEAVKTGVDTRRATEDPAGVLLTVLSRPEASLQVSLREHNVVDMPGSAAVVEAS